MGWSRCIGFAGSHSVAIGCSVVLTGKSVRHLYLVFTLEFLHVASSYTIRHPYQELSLVDPSIAAYFVG